MLADVFGRSHAQDYGKSIDTERFFKPLIGIHNLLVSGDFEHERARKMLNPAFHFVKLQSMISIMVHQTDKAIQELLSSSSEHQVIDLQTELNALTLAIIASSAFGKGFETIANAKQIVCRAFTELLAAISYRSIRMADRIPIISNCHFVDQIIADRRYHQSTSLTANEDILDLLSLLVTKQRVLQVCQEEVDRVLPNATELTSEHLSKLQICEAVLQETLRLYPPAPFIARRCIREHSIGSEGQRQLRIPVGAELSVNTYILHRREEYWSRPNEFDYTRWMRDPITDLKPKLAHPFCYLPFAAGPRNCIGQNFVLLEVKVMLTMLVQRCNFELEPGQKIVPDVRVTMRPKYGLRARITKRL